jgi:broad specificity phosphatase PhoE
MSMSESSPEIVTVRHGETEWSRALKHTGRTDVPLTDAGRTQADRLGAALAGRSFSMVLSSPLGRAVETCERAGYARHAEMVSDLREWDYGEYEGLTTAEVREQIGGWTIWTHEVHGGESVEEVGKRVDGLIERISAAPGDVVLFAHGHILRVMAARWLGLPAAEGRLFRLDTATISTLGFERETRVIRRWNDGCHLEEAAAS